MPESVSDESLRRTARCYRQGRVPVLTWRHPRTRALLARYHHTSPPHIITIHTPPHYRSLTHHHSLTTTHSPSLTHHYSHVLLTAGPRSHAHMVPPPNQGTAGQVSPYITHLLTTAYSPILTRDHTNSTTHSHTACYLLHHLLFTYF